MSVTTPAKSQARVFNAAALEGPERLVHESLRKVQQWVEEHGYEAYEPFDGLSTPVRAFTRHNLLLDRLLQQLSRQSPVNFRPLSIGRLGPLRALSAEDRTRALETMERGPLGLAVFGAKAPLCFIYYEHPGAARAIGFDGACLGDEP